MSALDRLHEQEIEDLIKIRQHALLSDRTEDDVAAWNHACLMALVLVKTENYMRFCHIFDALLSEVAEARNALEAERAMRRFD